MSKRISLILATFLILFVIGKNNIKAQCGADCSSCHALAFKDNAIAKEHTILDTCKDCHEEDGSLKNKNTSILDMTPNSHNAGCGGHCGDCHDQYPSDRVHFALNNCKNCHN